MSTIPSRTDAWTYGGAALAAVILVAHAWPSVETTVDDAWISARYAVHLAEGHGLVYNAGEPPIEGYTNPLWVVWLAFAHRLGLPMVGAMTWGGLAAAIVGLFAATALARRLAGRPSPWVLLAPLALALSPHYAVSATNGIETTMFAAAVLGALALAVGAESRQRRVAAGLALGLLGAVRPEGLGIAPLVGVAHLWEHRSSLRRQETWILPGLAFGGVAAIELWRWVTYGDLVPNTFHAKADLGLQALIRANGAYLDNDGWFWWVALPLVAIAPLIRPTRDRLLVGVVALVITAAALRVHLWMPAGRLLVPPLALTLTVLASIAAAEARGPARLARIGTLAFALAAAATLQGPVRAYDARHSVLADNGTARAGAHLRQHAPEGAWLAVRDAGVLAWAVGPEVRVAELHHRALTLPHPDGRDLDVSTLPRDPTFIAITQAREDATGFRYDNDRKVLTGVRVPYVYLGRVYQHYHRYYDLYAREDAGVPPLPDTLVVNRAGPRPPRRPVGAGERASDRPTASGSAD